MGDLDSRRVGTGEGRIQGLQAQARARRVGIGRGDPHQVRPKRPRPLAADLELDGLAGPRGKAVPIADQRYHPILLMRGVSIKP